MGDTALAQNHPDVGPLRVGTMETILGICELWLPGSYTEQDAEVLTSAVVDLALALQNRLGEVPTAPYQLVIVTNSDQMRQWTGRDMPEWIHALAIPRPSRLVLLGTDRPVSREIRERLENLILHELTHAYLQRISDDGSDRWLPAWFHEGLAVQMSGGMEPSLHRAVLWGRWRGRLYTLSELRTIPHKSAQESQLAYAQSALAIQFLTENHGAAVLPDVLDNLRDGYSFSAALQKVIGEPMTLFERRYLANIHRRYNLLLFVSDPAVIFTLLPLLLVTAYFVTVLRARRRKAQWDLQEQATRHETINPDEEADEMSHEHS